ncbi:MAG: right-handed parallel beta-helix repeat-containing protein [Kiritimatiellia bacterium]|nr:right-handed parallel beta-helix repeat-containing protein [Kiritimatiellia bacterium]
MNKYLTAMLAWSVWVCGALAQGDLIPPGPPSATMRTLEQIEPRQIISALPFSITNPGAYAVTGNLSLGSGNGIEVTSPDVTIDLNGFVLTGDPLGSGHGIKVAAGVENVKIRNGVLRDWSGDGIHAPGAGFLSIRDIQIYGVGGNGVAMNKGELIDAIAKDAGLAGVARTSHDMQKSIIQNLRAIANGGGGVVLIGMGAVQISQSELSGNTGDGISWVSTAVGEALDLDLDTCRVNGNTGDGLKIIDANTVRVTCRFSGTSFEDNGGDGIHIDLAAADCFMKIDGVEGECSRNGGDGINIDMPGTDARLFIKFAGVEGQSNKAMDNGGNGVTIVLSPVSSFIKLMDVKGEFTSNGGHGLYVEGGDKGSIDLEGSDFSANILDGLIVLGDDGIKPGSVRRVNASGNGTQGISVRGGIWRFSGCRAADNGGDGIRAELPVSGVNRWGEMIFEANDLVGNSGAGLSVPPVAGSITGTVVVAGGFVSGNATGGIIIADDDIQSGSVSKVVVTGNGEHGIVSAGESLSITDNLVFRNVGSGILIEGNGHHLSGNQCSENIVGIELVGIHNAMRESTLSGAAQIPFLDAGGNVTAPLQAIDAGTNPLGNNAF